MKQLSLSTRLLIVCLLAGILPLAILAAYHLHAFESSLRETVLVHLDTIADKKAIQVEQYMDERQAEASRLGRTGAVRAALAADDLAHPAAAARLREELAPLVETSSFADILLADRSGRIVFSQAGTPDARIDLRDAAGANSPLAAAVERALRSGVIQFSRFAPYAASGARAAFIVKPVQAGGAVVGALAARLDAERLQEVAGDRTGLGRTGETLLGQRDAGGAYYTGPLRHVPDAAFRHPVPESDRVAMHRALAGERGRGVMVDYAGHEVVAAWRFLPVPGWGMAIKIDTVEAFAPAARLREITLVGLGLALLLVTAAAYLLGTRLTRPIRALTRTADRIAAGDFSERATGNGCSEVTRLAQAFNSMNDALAHAREDLEVQIAERSQALRETLALQSAILDNAGALVVVLDHEGRIRRFNRACEALSHYSLAEVEGRCVWDFLLPPEEKESVHREAFLALVEDSTRASGTYTNHWLTRDGARPLIEWRNGVVRDALGRFGFLVSIGIDITEKARAEAALRDSMARLNEAQRVAAIGSWAFDPASGALEWSDEMYRLFEQDPAQFVPTYASTLAMVHAEDRPRVDAALASVFDTRLAQEISYRLHFPDGRVKWVHTRCEATAAGDALRATGTVQDITGRRQAEEAQRLYANVFVHSGEAIVITDSAQHILAANPAFASLTGYGVDEVLGRTPGFLASGQTPPETYQGMWAELEQSGYWQGEVVDRRKDGTLYPKWMAVSAVRDPEGRITHYVASFTDITARKQAEAQISRLAYHDALTGLSNRFSLQGQLEQALAMAHRERHGVAVIFLDLDRFKTINDTLGHAVGDALLKEAAHRLRLSVRESDIVSRLGGDEFVVVLSETDEGAAAALVGAKILRALGEVYTVDEHALHSSASLGVALYPDDGTDVETLMKHADAAMYHAKAQGRNNLQFFRPEMNEAAARRLTLDHDLREALAGGQFELHYQPLHDGQDGCVLGVEALVRWRHPQRGLVPPDDFIPVAEETGLILPLGEWVLDEACRQLRAWQDEGVAGLTVAVNLSAHQLHAPDLLAHVAQALERHGVDGNLLDLEITESVAMQDPDRSIRQLKALRTLGVRLSIDDFGTGYSSLNYLKLLPLHTLKLDKSFVRDIETDANDVAICTATIALAHSLGLRVVAEGVENEAQRHLLASHRCDIMQGYLFSPPLPPDAALEFIRGRMAA